MSNKNKVNKNLEVEDDLEIFGDTNLAFYDKNMLDLLMAAFSALACASFTKNISSSLSNITSFSYFHKILSPQIQKLDEVQQPGWYNKDYLIDGLLLINSLYSIMEPYKERNKSYRDLKEVFERFRCRYVTWEDSVK